MNAPRSAIRRGRKFEQVLEGARDVFLAAGFEGAGVDEIARQSGVSKATLYSYFPDKRLLFMEVAKRECRRLADDAEHLVACDAPVRDMLRFAADRMVAFFNSELAINVFRVCAAEADRFPDLAREFYRSGPALGRERLAEYFRMEAARGSLVIEDAELAADQFAELCKTRVFTDRMFGMRDRFSDDEIDRFAHEAVETFWARYGAR
ncbi:TetR family transcriptional regulator [Oceanicola sp. 22II-s10i]|uniref:TetR/AcrR family transcriptional regulator n=1 Tax=Oceanicola sp. 22II-s10i TaxID=1317116 RepID=UPI000B51F426|nr:TetR/AcrR family transcriptional regulator [Oceanicola sp. 22II-s10i]OWU86489.1 TetR family transcriptional regulator [Oceanicola sp. 22II-s10i]